MDVSLWEEIIHCGRKKERKEKRDEFFAVNNTLMNVRHRPFATARLGSISSGQHLSIDKIENRFIAAEDNALSGHDSHEPGT